MFYNQVLIKKNCIRIISTRSVVLDRSQSVLIRKMTKNFFFPQKIKYSFQGHFFPLNFFNISALHTGGGARPSAPRRGAPRRACPKGHAQKNTPKHVFLEQKHEKKKCIVFFDFFFDVFEIFDFSDDRFTKSSFGKKTGLIFSNFPKKCFGPGASEKPFGPSRGVRRRPGSRLRGSWGSPGRSEGRLGRVLGALGAFLEQPLRQSDFGSIF